jgi:uncharacterized protein (TIGR02246 family)
MMTILLACCSILMLARPGGLDDDAVSRQEIRARFDAFNEAWERRDMDFMRGFFAHEPDMLLFFERRQLRGWTQVETLYQNMFQNATPGTVHSTYSNLEVEAKGSMGYVAANFDLRVTNPAGESTNDSGRVTVVFERRDGEWVVVHRHTSFQAPPGPQRAVPLHTDPGPLWSPGLEGAWKTEDGALLVATATYVTTSGVPGLPGTARYRIADEGVWITPDGDPAAAGRLVELSGLTSSELVLRLPSGTMRFRKVE